MVQGSVSPEDEPTFGKLQALGFMMVDGWVFLELMSHCVAS
jgi:hypothetical protein